MLVGQVEKLENRLERQSDAFDQANRLLGELGVKSDLSNAGEVIPKFLVAWKGSQEFMHEYISLIEVAEKKKQVETRLRELRSAKPVVSELSTTCPATVPAAA